MKKERGSGYSIRVIIPVYCDGLRMIYGKKNLVTTDIQLAIGIKNNKIIGGPVNSIKTNADNMRMREKQCLGRVFLLKQKIREFHQLRDLNEKKISAFADYVKNLPGQKFVFLFYQRELLPYPEVPFESYEYLELMGELSTLVPQDIENIKQRFSDSSIAIHFLYITKPQREIAADYNSRQAGVLWEDISAGIFSTFLEMAQSTGGLTESSANIAFTLEKAAAASENYYLLYYSPKNYRADGRFRKIKVKVKGQDCRVTHRAGYYAD